MQYINPEPLKLWLIIIEVGSCLFDVDIFEGLVSRVGSSFLLDPPLNNESQVSSLKNVVMYAFMSYLGLGSSVKW